MAEKKTITYKQFLETASGNTPGWRRRFIDSLELGVPQRVPVEQSSNPTIKAVRNALGSANHRYGISFRVRLIDGELWACRLRDEDVDGK